MKTHLVWLGVAIAALLFGWQLAMRLGRGDVKPLEIIREVPAPIADVYLEARKLADSFQKAERLDGNNVLAGLAGVRVTVAFDDDARPNVVEREIAEAIEATLKKSGVPVVADAAHALQFMVDGVWDEKKTTLTYTARMGLTENARIQRPTGLKVATVIVWENGFQGFAASAKVGADVAKAAHNLAAAFATAYRAANGK
ncbi:MAG: hypothetical protein FJ399_19630 [Verrucomicrobia bacterium]|nr:hypothetical protein [Verrucomicrobiota bacterium]